MAKHELFSKRQSKLRGDIPDIYIYDEIPYKLKVQIHKIIEDAIGTDNRYYKTASELYENLKDFLCREYGTFYLFGERDTNGKYQLLNHIIYSDNYEDILDAIEITFKAISYIKKDYYDGVTVKIKPKDAILELNERFKENGVGYSFDGNQIIRIDSTYIHTEITKPTISLLWNIRFNGANEEYMSAHEHYKDGKNKECLNDCLKAFESTMKVICKEKGWVYNEKTDTAGKLIGICMKNGLIPEYIQKQFIGLDNLLATGIPTLRNKQGGHGQGQESQKVDDEMARYALNLTGSSIIFLAELSKL